MTDGDGSHSSEMRLDTCTKGVGLDLFSLGFAFLLCSLVLCLLSFRCLFPYQWGLNPPLREEDHFCLCLSVIFPCV
jgi:hypothetical protein